MVSNLFLHRTSYICVNLYRVFEKNMNFGSVVLSNQLTIKSLVIIVFPVFVVVLVFVFHLIIVLYLVILLAAIIIMRLMSLMSSQKPQESI